MKQKKKMEKEISTLEEDENGRQLQITRVYWQSWKW